jgi:hypothetical protein
MVNEVYIASTLVMGLLAVGVFALVMRSRHWHQYTPQAAYGQLDAGGSRPMSALGRFANTPSVWTLTFFLLALALLVGATVAASGGTGVLSGMGIAAALGVVVVGYLVGGVYAAMRQHGRSNAQAVAASAAALGVVFLLVLTLNLVLA